MKWPAPTLSMVAGAAERAWQYLSDQAPLGFPGAQHTMRFPRRAGFSSKPVEHRSDGFARGVIAELLWDCAALDAVWRERAQAWVRSEAAHLAALALQRKDGGLSYFPELQELPPDSDSLASAALLAARCAPELLPRWRPWIDLALAEFARCGRLPTWLISPEAGPAARRLMEGGVRDHWGTGEDPAVAARFLRMLLAVDRERHEPVVRAALAGLLPQRRNDGTWDATWYWGTTHPTALLIELQQAWVPHRSVSSPELEGLRRTQLDDGGWGDGRAHPLDTAHAVTVFARAEGDSAVLRAALACLLDLQRRDGAWNATAWIKMEAGRRQGGCCAPSFGSIPVSTAYALRALLECRRFFGEDGGLTASAEGVDRRSQWRPERPAGVFRR